MTEEQVKQVVANMFYSGELEIKLSSVRNPFTEKTEFEMQIFHKREDGYSKKLLSKSTRL